ncbi:endonuclease/exonuclease/phosphatase family protein [Pirellulaceae bacterium SH449]
MFPSRFLSCLFMVLALLHGMSEYGYTYAGEPIAISVMTYNVQFLPPPADVANKRPEPEYRAGRIAEEVAKYDVVGLQETFHTTHRNQIVEGLQKTWEGKASVLTAPQPKGFMANGGCLLLSRFAMTSQNTTVFQSFSKPTDYGLRADGFAAKGVIHGRLAINKDNASDTIDVYVTHLEARADQLRPKQYLELASFIKKTSDPASPMILLGDFNTNGLKEQRADSDSQYTQLMRALNDVRTGGVVDVWASLRANEHGGTTHQESTEIGKRIDYIFYSNPSQPSKRLVPKSIDVLTFQDERTTALSDHNAVVANFEWYAD